MTGGQRDKIYFKGAERRKPLFSGERRFRGDMIEVFKVLRELIRLDPDDIFRQATEDRTRGSGTKLWQSNCRLNVRENLFRNKVVGVWNKLSSGGVNG